MVTMDTGDGGCGQRSLWRMERPGYLLDSAPSHQPCLRSEIPGQETGSPPPSARIAPLPYDLLPPCSPLLLMEHEHVEVAPRRYVPTAYLIPSHLARVGSLPAPSFSHTHTRPWGTAVTAPVPPMLARCGLNCLVLGEGAARGGTGVPVPGGKDKSTDNAAIVGEINWICLVSLWSSLSRGHHLHRRGWGRGARPYISFDTPLARLPAMFPSVVIYFPSVLFDTPRLSIP